MIIVGALAVFVIGSIAKRPRVEQPRSEIHADASPPETVSAAPHREIAAAVRQSGSPAPVRDDAQIRALINETPGTYMYDMLADLKGTLIRWPDRRERGLRIWVQSMTNVRDWDPGYAQEARDAFDDWGREPLPIRFDFILDSATADVRVVWVDKFPPEAGRSVGVTLRTNDQNGWLLDARIDIAIHDSTGRTIPPRGLEGVMRHEAGHALGLGHSRDQTTKMFPVEMTPTITPADRATLRLLYRLPPGPVR